MGHRKPGSTCQRLSHPRREENHVPPFRGYWGLGITSRYCSVGPASTYGPPVSLATSERARWALAHHQPRGGDAKCEVVDAERDSPACCGSLGCRPPMCRRRRRGRAHRARPATNSGCAVRGERAFLLAAALSFGCSLVVLLVHRYGTGSSKPPLHTAHLAPLSTWIVWIARRHGSTGRVRAVQMLRCMRRRTCLMGLPVRRSFFMLSC